MRHDTRFLERHGNQYRVRVKVPDAARPVLGKAHLVVPLHTDSLVKANLLKWPIVAELKAQIAAALLVAEAKKAGGDPVMKEAMEWRDALAQGDPDDVLAGILLPDRAEEIERRHGTETALAFVGVAKGKATPILPLEPAWLAEANYAGRTEDARKQAVRMLLEWCRSSNIPETVEAIDRKTAGRFVSEVFIAKRKDPATANKLISGLSAFWKWMGKRGHAIDNPWERQSLTVKKVKTEDGEDAKRPFTDEEVHTLLNSAEGVLNDLCRFSALSGMRMGELAELRIRNVRGDVIRVAYGKTDAASRDVPVHPDLAALVTSRCEGKGPDDYLFHELPEQKNAASRSRSAPASQAFTRLRRKLGMDDRIEGRRQARADFHSFRRWFIRKAVEALEQGETGFTAWTIADVVGHSKEDGPLPMTMGRYPGTAGNEAKRACVEAVQLPSGSNAPP